MMGPILDSPDAIEANPSPMPVILPISQADRRKETPSENQAKQIPSAKIRYSFPLLPPVQKESPKVGWPECASEEEAAACAKAAEAVYRHLSSHQHAILALTSPRDGDGKTGAIVGIAPELAKLMPGGVLAVDANMHNPDLTSRLVLPFHRATAGPALIYPTNHAGLSVLLPGSHDRGLDPAWLVRMREDWPIMLVDLPSLEHPEATTLLCQCTGVYLVVRLGHTPIAAIAEAARLIPSHGGKLLGCLVIGEEGLGARGSGFGI
jgi:Mrp family chromosome partitioning ATPase